MALYLAKVTCWLMKNHTYMFNDVTYLQDSGTPIGLQIAVSISRLTMIKWDQTMTHLLISHNIRMELLLRYVDDVNIIFRVAISDYLKTEFASLAEIEQAVANFILKLADSVYPGVLKFEADVPSNHLSRKIPILDICCWIVNNIVMFEFYKKDVSSNCVLGPDSGFTPAVLRNILLQEQLRRLMNCCRELEVSRKMTHLSNFQY